MHRGKIPLMLTSRSKLFYMGKRNRIILRRELALFIMFSMLVLVWSTPLQDGNEDSGFKIIGCLPCSQKFIIGSYFEKENILDDLTFREFLIGGFSFPHSHPWLQKGAACPTRVSSIHWKLIGEGSHRDLIISMVYEFGDALSRLDADTCRVVLVERLPAGIFADPFELQNLVRHGAFLDAAVFGDTNLELPSALSNRTAVEIHMDIQHGTSPGNLNGSKFSVKLPLHVRYPPLNGSGYSRVILGQPDLMIFCRPRKCSDDCSSPIMHWNSHYSIDAIDWLIPCGSEKHSGVVSTITFLSALVSSLLMVYFAISYSFYKKDAKLE